MKKITINWRWVFSLALTGICLILIKKEVILPGITTIENLMNPEKSPLYYFPWWYKLLGNIFKPEIGYQVLVGLSSLISFGWLAGKIEEFNDLALAFFFIPWILWGIVLYPLATAGVLLVDWGLKSRKIILSFLGAGLSFPGAVLWGVSMNKRGQNQKGKMISVLLAGGVLLWMGTWSWKQGNLSKFQPGTLAQQINIQSSRELVASGEMITPWKLKRLAFNKAFLGSYKLGREVILAFDLESWFFVHGMQQNMTGTENLTEKYLLAAMDWVGALLLVISIVVIGRKKNWSVFWPMISIAFLVLIEGKFQIRHWGLLGIAVFYHIFREGLRKIKTAKIGGAVIMILMTVSFLSRSYELVFRPLVWQDNRVLAYKFVSDYLEKSEEEITVSSQFGPATQIVGYFSPQELAKNEFGELPKKKSSWPEGMYIGLEEELRQDEESQVWESFQLRDEIVTEGGKQVMVIKVEKENED